MYLPLPVRVCYANHFGWLSSSDTKKVMPMASVLSGLV